MTRTPARAGAGALSVVAVAALALGLSSCNAVGSNAATVNGSDITRADYERDLKALAANPSLLGLTGGTQFSIQGDAARSWLSQLIAWRAAENILADRGVSVSADTKKQFDDQLKANDAAQKLPKSMLEEIVDGAAAVQTLAQQPAPTKDELAKLYADAPASTGAMCLRHILVKTKAEAQDVLHELEGGADFATVAKQRSIEPAAKTTGGALTGTDGNACIPISTYQSDYDETFVTGALAARPGVPTDPVQSHFGWHVILARPFDEVSGDLLKLVGSPPADAGAPYALRGALGTADVTIDPRYGRWDQIKSDVVSLH